MTQQHTEVQPVPERAALIEMPGRGEEHEAELPGQRWRYGSALAAARALNAQDLARARR